MYNLKSLIQHTWGFEHLVQEKNVKCLTNHFYIDYTLTFGVSCDEVCY